MMSKTVTIEGVSFQIAGRAGDPYFDHLGEGRDNRFLRRVADTLPNEVVIFDVGANMGVTTALLNLCINPAAIYSFEPTPEAFQYLVETVRLNGFQRCYPINIALGAVPGEASFLHNTDSSGASHLVTEQTLGGGNIIVKVSTIDEEVSTRSISRLDLIKIDVEGFESDVLSGSRNTLASLKPKVFLEFNSFAMMCLRDVYPRAFLGRLLSEFPFVYRMCDDASLARIETQADQINFIHDNLVKHGCVSDLLCCWAEGDVF